MLLEKPQRLVTVNISEPSVLLKAVYTNRKQNGGQSWCKLSHYYRGLDLSQIKCFKPLLFFKQGLRNAIDQATQAGEEFSNVYYETLDKRRHVSSSLVSSTTYQMLPYSFPKSVDGRLDYVVIFPVYFVFAAHVETILREYYNRLEWKCS